MELVSSVRHSRCGLPTSSWYEFFFKLGPLLVTKSYPVSFIVQLCYIARSMCPTFDVSHIFNQRCQPSRTQNQTKDKGHECAGGEIHSQKHSQHTQGSLNDPKGNYKRVTFNNYYTYLLHGAESFLRS